MSKYSFIESCLYLPNFLNKKKLREQLNGKVVLITGASSGIGEQIAYLLADSNCHMILVARRGEKLLEMKNEIEQKVAKVSFFQADMRNEDQMSELLSFLHTFNDGLDVVLFSQVHLPVIVTPVIPARFDFDGGP